MWRGNQTYLEADPNVAPHQKSPERRAMESLFAELRDFAPAGFSAGLHIRFASPLVYVRTYPESWTKHYDTNAYALRDPLVFWGLASKGQSRWSDIGVPDPFGILKKARAHGMNFGAVFSVGPITSRSIIGVARSDRELTDSELDHLARLSAELHTAAEPQTELTPAQVEALRLLAEGDRHTACLLYTSPSPRDS